MLQAYVQAWQSLPSLKDPDRFEAWLTRILVNACYADLRRRARRPAGALRLLPNEATVPDPSTSVEQRDQLERAFSHLSPEQRATFVRHHHAGLSLVDSAAATRTPVGTVKSRLHYATHALRAAIRVDDHLSERLGRHA